LQAKILITGANGFVGKALSQYISHIENACDYELIKAVRDFSSDNEKQTIAVGDINQQTDWQQALTGVDTVVHLAARVHVMQETSTDPLQSFRKTNVEGTINLAQQAIKAGVKRFIYLSTIKVNGERTLEKPFSADDIINPRDPYAVSKSEAESALLQLHQQQLLDVIIIRPPLVYGQGVKGNFSRLINLLRKQWPLPLAGIENKRSLVSIDNLCSLIICCISHDKAPGEVFLVSDGLDVSTTQLLTELAMAMQCKSNLFRLPASLFKMAAIVVGRGAEYQRLFESLQVDINKNKRLLGWQPELSLRQALTNYFGNYSAKF
jgi:UDP-N-acetyl-alpha-D-quinovosamine dehydrogenase